jgi:hypothetical protein
VPATTTLTLAIAGTATKKVTWSLITLEPYYDMTVGSNLLSVGSNLNVSLGNPVTDWDAARMQFTPGRTIGTTTNVVLGENAHIVSGNNLFVVAYDAPSTNVMTYITSTDGVNWTAATGIVGVTAVRGLAYNGTTYLMISGQSPAVVYSSTTGSSGWTLLNTPTMNSVSDMVYGNGMFVACTNAVTTNNIMSSANGSTWATTNTTPTVVNALGYGNMSNSTFGTHVFVAVGTHTLYYNFTNGSNQMGTWAAATTSQVGTWRYVGFGENTTGNDIFMATSGTEGRLTTSTDGGRNWTTPVSFNETLYRPLYVEGTWFIGSATGVYVSKDKGATWTKRTGETPFDGVYGGKSVVVGTTVSVLTKKNQRSDGSSISPDTLTLGKEGTTINVGADLMNVANIGGVNNRLSIAGNVNVSMGAATTTVRFTSITNTFINPRIAYGGGRFVIAGETGKVMYSNDGTTWTLAATAFPNVKPHSLAYGNGIFMIVTDEDPSKVYTSSDGNTWNQISYTGTNYYTPTPAAGTIYSVFSIAYGNNYFIGVRPNSATDNLMVSNSTGTSWRAIKCTAAFSGVCFGTMSSGANPHVFLVFGTNDVRRIATNSSVTQATLATEASWITPTTTPPGSWYYSAFGNDIFMIASTDNRLAISLDAGITWSVTVFTTSLYGILYVNNEWYLASSSGIYVSKNNGSTWALRNSATVEYFASSGMTVVGVVNGNTQFVISPTNQRLNGSALRTDTITIGQEGTTTVIGSETMSVGPYKRLTIGGNVDITIGSATSTMSSTSVSLTQTYGQIAYGNGVFVVSGDTKRLYYSTDGVVWNVPTTTFTGTICFRGLVFGDNRFMLISQQVTSRVWTSPDGNVWTPATNVTFNVYWLTYGNGAYLAVAATASGGNDISISTDNGISWTNSNTGAVSLIGTGFGTMVNTSNGTNIFIVGGLGYIKRRADGGSWETPTTMPLNATTANWRNIAFGNDTFIATSWDSPGLMTISRDAGKTWSSAISFGSGLGNLIYAENVWYASTNTNVLLVSRDNALSWVKTTVENMHTQFAYGNSKIVGATDDKITLYTIKRKRNDGTNITADVLTLGNEGTTTTLGAPLTVGYSPSQITNLNQIGYNIRVGPSVSNIAANSSNYICVVQIPIGVWLVSSQVYWNGYTGATGQSNSINKNTTSTGTGGTNIINFYGGIMSTTSLVENNTMGTIYYSLNNYNNTGAIQNCYSGSSQYTFLSFTRIG